MLQRVIQVSKEFIKAATSPAKQVSGIKGIRLKKFLMLMGWILPAKEVANSFDSGSFPLQILSNHVDCQCMGGS